MKVPSMYDKRRCVLNRVCHFPAEWAVDGPWGGGLCGKHPLSCTGVRFPRLYGWLQVINITCNTHCRNLQSPSFSMVCIVFVSGRGMPSSVGFRESP